MPPEIEITLTVFPNYSVKGAVIPLTPELADEQVMGDWWRDDCLEIALLDQEIDRYWDWNSLSVVIDGRALPFIKMAAVTGRGEDLTVQGAMVVTTEPIKSALEPNGSGCLQIEYLFTAPRNRPHVRRDRQQFVMGIGTQLLIWGAMLSREKGCEGRLRLDASPKFVGWYARRGLQKLDLSPIVYEETEYTPMELPVTRAQELLSAWE